MADVNAAVIVAGEVRLVTKKRDFTDNESGETREGKGRRIEVLTMGGFLKVSVPAKFDGLEFAEGSVCLLWADVVPWTVVTKNGPKSGTAFVYTGDVDPGQVTTLFAPSPAAVKAGA